MHSMLRVKLTNPKTMKRFLLLALAPLISFSQDQFIHVDQFGYRSANTKVAVISDPQTGFNSSLSYSAGTTLQVRDATTDAVIFSAAPTLWNSGNTHSQSGDRGWWFDFSTVQQAGEYYIFDPSTSEASHTFRIDDHVYDDVLKAALKMFYYNRCGIAKTTPYVPNGYTDLTSFAQDSQARDVYNQGDTSTEKDMSGGWFDAGDYNKYVTFAESAVHSLLWAYQNNPSVFDDALNIPESGNGIPDIIDELKWETDWLLKMINADGSVHIKIGARNFSENAASPPSSNTDTRYYAPTCTSAAIAMAGMLAHSAKVFGQFPSLSTYAQTLEDQAIATWNWVLPSLNNNTLQENCDDGSVVAGDADRTVAIQRESALIAAIYLFDLTGNSSYNQYIIDNLNDAQPFSIGDWSNYKLMILDALFLYTTISGNDTTTRTTILNAATTESTNNYNNYLRFNTLDLYRGYTNDWTYHWGSNSPKADMGNLNFLYADYDINTDDLASLQLRAKENLHYFHGVNPMGLVYLSNMYALGAEKSVNEIYHSWFYDGTVWDNAITSTYGPPPGYVPGGSNSTYSANTNLSPPYDQPLQKSYLDFNTGYPDNSWEISEPGIYYQAAYVRLLSRIANLEEGNVLSNPDPITDNNTFSLQKNPITEAFIIQHRETKPVSLKLYAINGRRIDLGNTSYSTNTAIPVNQLSPGVYLILLEDESIKRILKLVKL